MEACVAQALAEQALPFQKLPALSDHGPASLCAKHFPALSRLLLDSLTKLQTWRTEVCVLQPLVCLCSAHQFRALLLSLPVKSLMILASCMGLSFAVLILACAFYSNWLPMTMCECEVFRVIVLVARWCGPDTSVVVAPVADMAD